MSDTVKRPEGARPMPGSPGSPGGPGRPGGGPRIGFGPPGGPMLGEKAKDFKGAMGKLIRYVGKYKSAVLAVAFMSVLATVLMIVGPKVLANITNDTAAGLVAIARGTGTIDFDAIKRTMLLLVGLYGTSALCHYLQNFIMSGVTNRVTYRLRQDISRKINSLPLRFFESTSQGEILSRVTNDVDTINQSLQQSVSQIISSITSVVGVMIMMLTINGWMTLVTLAIVPFSMVLTLTIVKKSQKHFRVQQEFLGHVNGHIEETYGGQTVVKAFRAEKRRVGQFEALNDTLFASAWKAQFLSGLIMPAIVFIGNLGYVAVCVLGGYLAGIGAMDIGGIQAFLQYVRMFNQPISQVAQISNVLQQTAAAAERVFGFLGEQEETPDEENAVTVVRGENGLALRAVDEHGRESLTPFVGEIVFDHVSFGYTPEKRVVHDFSACVRPGQKIAIVGHTGAGKTTIVKLLMRFYDVDEGRITIDGHDIRRFRRCDLRELLGMVLQDTWLYNDTIMENIRYGTPQASDEQVVAAAKAARADRFIKTITGGYQDVINEESTNISQGQKQLLTIARAVLKDPEILILDEATSSVDTKTEKDIQRAMDGLMKDRTSFVIAHRLSTIRDCKLILVMEEGDIVEQGTHDELLAQNGTYAALYNAQFEQVG